MQVLALIGVIQGFSVENEKGGFMEGVGHDVDVDTKMLTRRCQINAKEILPYDMSSCICENRFVEVKIYRRSIFQGLSS